MSVILSIYQNKILPGVDPNESFEGRTVLVTGSNVGLGFEAASKFAHLRASRLILAVRTIEKGEQAKKTIEQRLKSSPFATNCNIEIWQLDMTSYDSVKAFAARVDKELSRLDVALLNAGVWKPAFNKSQHGWEEVVQVNTLSTTLLALLLLPKLKATKESTGEVPTLEIVSSGTHTRANLTPEQMKMEGSLIEYFNMPENFEGKRQYGMSKLFVMCALAGLVDIVSSGTSTSESKTADVWCTSCCPGLCKSDLSRDLDSFTFQAFRAVIFTLIGRTTEQGSRTLVSACTIGQRGHGEFWQHDRIQPTTALLAGEDGKALKSKVWNDILDALSKDVPNVRELTQF